MLCVFILLLNFVFCSYFALYYYLFYTVCHLELFNYLQEKTGYKANIEIVEFDKQPQTKPICLEVSPLGFPSWKVCLPARIEV